MSKTNKQTKAGDNQQHTNISSLWGGGGISNLLGNQGSSEKAEVKRNVLREVGMDFLVGNMVFV